MRSSFLTTVLFCASALAAPQAVSTTTSPRPSATTTTRPAQSSSSSSSSSSSTTSNGPVVTDAAYINTVLRHHNIHRSNHSANALKWSSPLADIAKSTAEVCYWAHNTTAGGGGYGQNIGAGYSSQQMGAFFTDLYSEVNLYNAYGGEPSTQSGIPWGHFTQMVWVGTTNVGCYTADCSNAPGGLRNLGGGIRPFFTVCNYGPAGNVIGSFAKNVLVSKGLPIIGPTYGCTGQTNPNINCV